MQKQINLSEDAKKHLLEFYQLAILSDVSDKDKESWQRYLKTLGITNKEIKESRFTVVGKRLSSISVHEKE